MRQTLSGADIQAYRNLDAGFIPSAIRKGLTEAQEAQIENLAAREGRYSQEIINLAKEMYEKNTAPKENGTKKAKRGRKKGVKSEKRKQKAGKGTKVKVKHKEEAT